RRGRRPLVRELLQRRAPQSRAARGRPAGLRMAGRGRAHRRRRSRRARATLRENASRPARGSGRAAEYDLSGPGNSKMSTALQALEIRLQEALGRAVIGLEPVIRALTVAIVA